MMFGKIRTAKNFMINTINLKRKKVIYGKNLKIQGIPYFYGDVKLGDNCIINSGKKFNMIGGDSCTLFRTHNNAKIIIGNNVGISNSTFVASKDINIEDDVLIGGSCKFYTTDFHSLQYEHRMLVVDTDIKIKSIHIKRGAFIGAHSIILKGVTIGEKSIVGAGSVVTKSISDGEIWGGNPAKFIRTIETESNGSKI